MVNEITILARVVDKNASSTLDLIANKISALGDRFDAVSNTMRRNGVQAFDAIRSATKKTDVAIQKGIIDRLREQQKVAAKALKEQETRMRNLRNATMVLGFSFLFLGIQIKRLSESALRSIITTYDEVMSDTSEFAVLTNTLSAHWAFFKFSIMEALMQSGLFQMFISWLINIINVFTKMPSSVKNIIVVLLLLGVVGGGVFSFLGQMMLLFAARSGAAGSVVLLSMLEIFAVILLVAGAVVLMSNLWSSETSKLNKVLLTLVTLLTVGSIIAFLFGASFVGGVLLAAAAILGLIVVALAFKEELGIIIGFIILGFIELGRVILEVILLPLRAVLFVAAKLAKLLGFDGVSEALDGVSEAINGVREKIAGLETPVKNRIDELMEQRETRGSFMERTGLNALIGTGAGVVSGLSTPLVAPEVPVPSSSGGSVSQVDNSIENLNIVVNQQPGESLDEFINRLVERFEEERSISLGSTVR